jgi:hypothetical protein
MSFTDKVINGGDILLSIDGLVVACATSHSVELTNAVREVSCKGSGDFTSAEYGRFSWTVSTDALLNLGQDENKFVDYASLMKWMKEKAIVTITSRYEEGSDAINMYGGCIITSISKTAGDNENASYSVSLQGRGELNLQLGTLLNKPTVTLDAIDSSSADLTWIDNNTQETGYLIEFSEDGSAWLVAGEKAANSTDFTVTGLESATDYKFRVTALGGGLYVNSYPSDIIAGTTT